MPSAHLTDTEVVRYITEITTGLKPVVVRRRISVTQEAVVTVMLRQPFGNEKRLAQLKYDEAFDKAKKDGFRTRHEIQKDFVEKYEIYTEADRAKESNLKGEIEALKVMYKSALTPQYKANYKEKINAAEEKYYDFISKKLMFEKFSVETIAEVARLKYFVYCCALDLETLEQIWKTYESFQNEDDNVFIGDLLNQVSVFILGYPSDVLRAIARSYQWRSVWNISAKTQAMLFGMPVGTQRAGTNPFSSAVADWSNAQIQLCSWSIFYDNLMQSPEPPPHQVLEDDDLCDKYVEKQIEKQEKERFKSLGPKSPAAGGTTDIFILGSEKEFLFDPETGELRK
jgi:hypothetical protein